MTSALRGAGVPSKADIVSNLSKGGCVNLQTRGEGVKKSKKIADVLNGSPPHHVSSFSLRPKYREGRQVCDYVQLTWICNFEALNVSLSDYFILFWLFQLPNFPQ